MEPLTFKTKQEMHAWFTTEPGEAFIEQLKIGVEDHIRTAHNAADKFEQPDQQIAAHLNRARGIQEIVDFIEAIDREVKERKEEGELEEDESE